ncbi:MAG: bifunctional folylpolyglutamate synthase/dihydrofolate synthase [Lachnospiraceae bacterium]|nr:bifunctional folylpolyglutamate synthase/dihydrofolate synthase [Lachnospiraceae bacterium]
MIDFTLERIRALCGKLNDPQDELNVIHIAGTNGKGSVAAFLSSVLKESGLKVGTYTSPAVFSDEEVIRVNGRPITKKEMKEGLGEIFGYAKELYPDASVSEFEALTALAFRYFREKQCDVAVIEAGMGGELDATNIVKGTKVCVFTPISRDHTEYLGGSLHKIASNKAGILKPGCIALSAGQPPEALSALEERAKALAVPFLTVDPSAYTVKYDRRKHLMSIDLSVGENVLKDLPVPLPGKHQAQNAALAVTAARLLFGKCPELSLKIPQAGLHNMQDPNLPTVRMIRKGLHNTKHPGRFEILSEAPVIILDGAHNIGGAAVLKETLGQYYGGRRIIGIAGMLKDKDHEAVFGELAPCLSRLFTISTFGERGYDSSSLAADAPEEISDVTSIGGLEEAIELALLSAGKKDVILIFGSLSILKAAKRYIGKLASKESR